MPGFALYTAVKSFKPLRLNERDQPPRSENWPGSPMMRFRKPLSLDGVQFTPMLGAMLFMSRLYAFEPLVSCW